MLISYNWLIQYLQDAPSPDEMSQILTSVGLEVESMEKLETIKGGLEGLVIGKVIECVPHPDADKLRLTRVDIGTGTELQIVCGAPNVAIGQTVVVAPIGTTIYPAGGNALTMKKAKIRGVDSEGMICAEDEIGLGSGHDGILVIPAELQPGTAAKEYFKPAEPDYIFEIGLTPNRMDSMSHMGVARDVCAYLSNISQKTVAMKMPETGLPETDAADDILIEITDPVLCPRYAGVSIRGIRVEESPAWLQTRLKAIGLRPVNNIVDITNFVLHECGQPLHAFDTSAIKGNKIVVRTAKAGETFLTLDEKERSLTTDDIMICNESEPMCIAGIFGGLRSGVSLATSSIFLESAWFEPVHIRRTSMRLGLRTDAAIRFEKGTDISMVNFALQRAASLIRDLAGGQVTSTFQDVYPQPFVQKKITLSYEGMNALAGKSYDKAQVKNILNSLCFDIVEESGDQLVVTVTFAKNDIRMQADVVEEIMRIDGLDNIPFTGKINYSIPAVATVYTEDLKKKLSGQLCGKGFFEIFTNSITNSSYYGEQQHLVKMMNSLSANLDTMRPSMLETGLEAIAYNLNRKNNRIRFFEFGKIYSRDEQRFIETEQLCLYISGFLAAPSWHEKEKPSDLFYLKGIVASLLSGMPVVFQPEGNALQITYRKKKIGQLSKVDDAVAKQFDIKQEVFFAELNWAEIKEHYRSQKIRFTEIPRFPVMERDLAIVIDKGVSYLEVQKNIKSLQSKLLRDISVFDVFESEKLGTGKKSYAISLSFYNDERTLTDVEVEGEMNKVIESLESKLGASIRK